MWKRWRDKRAARKWLRRQIAVGNIHDFRAEMFRRGTYCYWCSQRADFRIRHENGREMKACKDCATELITSEHPTTGERIFPGWSFAGKIDRV